VWLVATNFPATKVAGVCKNAQQSANANRRKNKTVVAVLAVRVMSLRMVKLSFNYFKMLSAKNDIHVFPKPTVARLW